MRSFYYIQEVVLSGKNVDYVSRESCREAWLWFALQSKEDLKIRLMTSEKQAKRIIELISEKLFFEFAIEKKDAVRWGQNKQYKILRVHPQDVQAMWWFILFQRIAQTVSTKSWNTLEELLELSNDTHYYYFSFDRYYHIKAWRNVQYIAIDSIRVAKGIISAYQTQGVI